MRKRIKHLVMVGVLFITYFILTDPSSGIIKNLTYGADLMIMLQSVVMALVGGVTVEIFQRLWWDGSTDESNLIDESKRGNIAASNIYIGNSLRIIGYAIIVAASIMSIR